MTDTDRDAEFEAVLDHVKRTRGFDFTGYKRPTLRRRIDKRVQKLGLDGYTAYLDHLQVRPDEFTQLFDTVLINVTSFFRDPESWTHMADEILPRLLAGKDVHAPIRVWSAGCASGEEAYSIAILLAEHLGRDRFTERVKIYGTDVDEDALIAARHAVYSPEELEDVPEELRERYFDDTPGNGTGHAEAGLQFRGDLRRSVIFGRHDLVQDAPISRLDLLVCRNTLMYLNAEVQSHVLDRFHFALRPHGVLFLGKAEKLLSHGGMFTPLDSKRRFFAKVSTDEPRIAGRGDGAEGTPVERTLAANVGLRDAALDAGPVAMIAVDHDGHLALANAAARSEFRLESRDLGRPLRDLELSYRPAELRGAIDRAHELGRFVELQDVEWQPEPGEARRLDVTVIPLRHAGESTGTVVAFIDVTDRQRWADQVDSLVRELEAAHEELQSSNEELETTNEELQSTVEELETTNEELQSTNEELETMNEELQSTNDELHVANEELVQRGEELNEVNAFLAAVLRSLRRAVVVVDPDLVVRVWNHEATDVWGLRADEVVGQHFLNLDVGLPVEQLREALRDCVNGTSDHEARLVDARNRRGMDIACHVACSPLVGPDGESLGAIMLMEERRD